MGSLVFNFIQELMKAQGARNLAQNPMIPLCGDEKVTLPGCLRSSKIPFTLRILGKFSSPANFPCTMMTFLHEESSYSPPKEKMHASLPLTHLQLIELTGVKTKAYDWHICFSIDIAGGKTQNLKCHGHVSFHMTTKDNSILHTKSIKGLTMSPKVGSIPYNSFHGT